MTFSSEKSELPPEFISQHTAFKYMNNHRKIGLEMSLRKKISFHHLCSVENCGFTVRKNADRPGRKIIVKSIEGNSRIRTRVKVG